MKVFTGTGMPPPQRPPQNCFFFFFALFFSFLCTLNQNWENTKEKAFLRDTFQRSFSRRLPRIPDTCAFFERNFARKSCQKATTLPISRLESASKVSHKSASFWHTFDALWRTFTPRGAPSARPFAQGAAQVQFSLILRVPRGLPGKVGGRGAAPSGG